MSKNDKKAIQLIILLGRMLKEGHFKIYYDDVFYYLQKLSSLYYPQDGTYTNDELADIKDATDAAEKMLCDVGYTSSIGVLMNFVLEVADSFALHCTGERGEVWNQFLQMASNNEIVKNLSKNFDIQKEQIERGIQVAEIVYKTQSIL